MIDIDFSLDPKDRGCILFGIKDPDGDIDHTNLSTDTEDVIRKCVEIEAFTASLADCLQGSSRLKTPIITITDEAVKRGWEELQKQGFELAHVEVLNVSASSPDVQDFKRTVASIVDVCLTSMSEEDPHVHVEFNRELKGKKHHLKIEGSLTPKEK